MSLLQVSRLGELAPGAGACFSYLVVTALQHQLAVVGRMVFGTMQKLRPRKESRVRGPMISEWQSDLQAQGLFPQQGFLRARWPWRAWTGGGLVPWDLAGHLVAGLLLEPGGPEHRTHLLSGLHRPFGAHPRARLQPPAHCQQFALGTLCAHGCQHSWHHDSLLPGGGATCSPYATRVGSLR